MVEKWVVAFAVVVLIPPAWHFCIAETAVIGLLVEDNVCFAVGW